MKEKLLRLSILTSLAPLSVFAQVAPTQGVPSKSGGIDYFIGVLTNIIDWFFYIILIIAILFFLYAGFVYITGGSDPDKQKTAKDMMIYAVIGVAIALMAQAFVFLAASLTGTTVTAPF